LLRQAFELLKTPSERASDIINERSDALVSTSDLSKERSEKNEGAISFVFLYALPLIKVPKIFRILLM
jgi:hypothetical protein